MDNDHQKRRKRAVRAHEQATASQVAQARGMAASASPPRDVAVSPAEEPAGDGRGTPGGSRDPGYYVPPVNSPSRSACESLSSSPSDIPAPEMSEAGIIPAGSIVACPNGHRLYRLLRTVGLFDRFLAADFVRMDGRMPEARGGAEVQPFCPECGARWCRAIDIHFEAGWSHDLFAADRTCKDSLQVAVSGRPPLKSGISNG